MMGPKQEAQSALVYGSSIEDYVPSDHILNAIDGIIDLPGVRKHLTEFYSPTGRPSIDPERMIRMLLSTILWAFSLNGDYVKRRILILDLSRLDAAPLIAFAAPKEIDYGAETDGRIPPRCGARGVDLWAYHFPAVDTKYQ